MRRATKNAGWMSWIGLTMVCAVGCSGWLPVQSPPPPIERSLGKTEMPKDTVGIESILIRLNTHQAARLSEVWSSLDEQIVAPETRLALDRNGLRAGKAAGHLPATLEEWVRANERRRDEDPMEQVGLAADVSAFAQLWRCRADSRKELTIRKLLQEDATVFFHDGSPKGGTYRSPHFLYTLQSVPFGDASALVKLTPELQHGEARRMVVAKDSAIRTDERRDSLIWEPLAIEMRLQRGDCIVIGATPETRGLGEHFFQTRTKEGEMQHVLLLVRLSEARQDDWFAPVDASKPQRSIPAQ
jgi:hypothetical protein